MRTNHFRISPALKSMFQASTKMNRHQRGTGVPGMAMLRMLMDEGLSVGEPDRIAFAGVILVMSQIAQ